MERHALIIKQPYIHVVRPLHGASILLEAQLFLLSPNLLALPHDALLLPTPLVLDSHPFTLKVMPFQAVSIETVLLNLGNDQIQNSFFPPSAIAEKTKVADC